MAKRIKKMKYSNREIEIATLENDLSSIKIGKVQFKALYNPSTKEYHSNMLPYQTFDKLDKLIKKVVDIHPDFRVQ